MARSVVDVAAYILERTDTITTMKLQKLAFYSQAQHLAQYGVQLFPEDFQAWRGGPVVPELYALHRGKFLIRPGELEGGDSSTLTDHERSVIDNVCAAMGHATGAELSERTHRESPWLDARDGRKPSEPSDTVITQDAMHSYYLEHPVLI
ncbi:Panacea domain-containing protein [Actinomyces bouchesdurhonensis]|uniref:Panacea domain-containing protein n=1 Tax=Actinomyces bouchesdurhonensis TaxID=1852361 RepID=UPI003AF10057